MLVKNLKYFLQFLRHFSAYTILDYGLMIMIIDWLYQEEMPIVICQIDKYEEPFASCSLPLREALLHTNRRADMSLSLVCYCLLLHLYNRIHINHREIYNQLTYLITWRNYTAIYSTDFLHNHRSQRDE